MSKRKEIIVEETIDEIAPGGDGVAITLRGGERRAIFTRLVAPGEHVKLAVDFSERPARGRLLEVLTKSPDRVTSPCAVAATCGGCDLIHLSGDAQRAIHERHVRAALPVSWQAIGIDHVRTSEALGYRTRARLHLRSTGGRAIVGMFAPRTHKPVEVDTCVVLAPSLDTARARIGPLFEGAHGTGEAALALGQGGLAVADIHWNGRLPAAVFGRLDEAVRTGAWAGIRLFDGAVSRPVTIGDPTPWQRGADGAPLKLVSGGFAQASETANATLVETARRLVDEALEGDNDPEVVELYAGVGNFTVVLARRSQRVTAVEANHDACLAASENLKARGLKATLVEKRAEDIAFRRSMRLVILDPPRTGAVEVARRLAESQIKRVLYISCDPQTLKRDLAILETTYDPIAVKTVSMFPQTSHIETLVSMKRR